MNRKLLKYRMAEEICLSIKEFYLPSNVSSIRPIQRNVFKMKNADGTVKVLQKEIMKLEISDD